jgi:YqiJ-like protein
VSAFFASELWPFTLAVILLVALAATEGIALLLGASPSHWVDGALADMGDADIGGPEGPASAALGWLHFGKVPVLVILVIFLTAFAVAGYAVQLVAQSAAGHFAPLVIAVAVAFVVGLLAVRALGTAIGRLVPRDESSAVPDASLVGRVGTIVIGTARAGRPAEARIHDEHGATQYVMVEPEDADETFAAGARVLLVRHLSGRRFHAIHNPKPDLL